MINSLISAQICLLLDLFYLRYDIFYYQLLLLDFLFPFTVTKHTNYGSSRCMGLSSPPCRSNISGFRQFGKQWQNISSFLLQNS